VSHEPLARLGCLSFVAGTGCDLKTGRLDSCVAVRFKFRVGSLLTIILLIGFESELVKVMRISQIFDLEQRIFLYEVGDRGCELAEE